MQEKDRTVFVKQMRDAFTKSGVDLSKEKVGKMILGGDCGYCDNDGCKSGCSSGCMDSCSARNR